MSPSYLVHQKSSWCFRIRVPDDLRGKIGLKELRYSLRTGSIGEGKIKARKVAGKVQSVFVQLRKRGSSMEELSQSQTQEMLSQFIRESLEEDEEYLIERKKPLDPDQLDDEINSLEYVLSDFREALATGNHKKAERYVDSLLEEQGISLDKGSLTYKRLCREMLKAQIEGLEVVVKRRMGDYSSPASYGTYSLTPKKVKTSASLEEIIKSYWEENTKAGNWSERTKVEYDTCLRVTVKILGNPPIHTIDHQRMREFKEILMKLPVYLNSPVYEDRSIDEILKMDYEKTLSISTVNKYFGVVKAVFNHAIRNNHIQSNPAEGLQITKKKRKRCGVTDKDKTFHSFRHGFINYLKQKEVNFAMINQLVGHTDSDITSGLYGKSFPPEKLYKEAISKMDFGIDLTPLKKSRFCG